MLSAFCYLFIARKYLNTDTVIRARSDFLVLLLYVVILLYPVNPLQASGSGCCGFGAKVGYVQDWHFGAQGSIKLFATLLVLALEFVT